MDDRTVRPAGDEGFKQEIVARVTRSLDPDAPEAALVPLLLARPPAEDLAAFAPEALARAAACARRALEAHRPGMACVTVETPDAFDLAGAPQQLVTVVNDDRPFLFDSVIAEIAETMPEIHYISHPILDVRRSPSGRIEGLSPSAPGETRAGASRPVSLIQVATDKPADPEAPQRLKERLEAILRQVALANTDFEAMRERTRRAAGAIRQRAARLAPSDRQNVEEGASLLEWLADDNFIFLGTREFDYSTQGGEALTPRPGGELGILRDPAVRVLRREGAEAVASPEMRAFLEGPDPLIVAKANARSLVHRRVYMDYIGVKEYGPDGRLAGELRIVGLFTSAAYTQPILSIPYLRRKAQTVIDRFGLYPKSHSAKALLNALETYSRDEVFQIDVDLLERFVGIILELGERPRVRVLPRIDPFDRFVSVLVFVPRERYDQRLREAIGFLLAEAYDGRVSAYYPSFPEGPLASVHFIVGRSGGPTPRPDPRDLEARIVELARNWVAAFERELVRTKRSRELMTIAPGLPDGYREVVDPAEAVVDAERIHALSDDRRLWIDFYRREGDPAELLRLKLYSLDHTLALSTRVPILENLGFAVGSEHTFDVPRPDGRLVHLHDMDLTRRHGGPIDLADGGAGLEAAFSAVFQGLVENDAFNALVLEAGFEWRAANLLRAYARYLRQTGLAYTGEFIAATLLRHPDVARGLLELFRESFEPGRERAAAPPGEPAGDDPQAEAARARGASERLAAIREALDAVDSLDDDRILRRFVSVILATLRTNYYSVPDVSADPNARPGAVKPALAFKLDPKAIEGMPQPVPFREMFVFDARVEGVHLRFGRIARGGLRWSDRSQDYRTEVLGLVKAQQVKNAVIVPVGAKGGFYPKRLPEAGSRDEWFEAGRSAYVVFIASLLSLTDNVTPQGTVTPQGIVAHDEPDPYFVVAADKGTATFSDTANAIAVAEDFWLDDAFASGGSAGYDHKAMGITARGAWEAVKRHFREMGKDGRAWDIQTEPFTVAGCGDMSGDVFGNGMLLSRQIRLVAAFDHRDIFIDPDPDPAVSFAERKRLFDKPRSSWADYDPKLISIGGGVFSRREKLIRLSDQAAAAIGWDRRSGTPAEIINAILKSPVDLLWFGGIGTYIRSSSESNADVGDRANDSVRVAARELRASIIGEGANLGVTQAGRIEFARAGGRINTDAIDNSAGVNTSDVEVNIKIALKNAMAQGRLARPDRDRLLAGMTGDVAGLVLANNYDQTLAISLEAEGGVGRLPLQARFMTLLEEARALDREVETLPGEAAIADLKAAGRGLTRPEIAVLLAYAKIDLFNRLAESDLPDDLYLTDRLFGYFPTAMRAPFAADIERHRLRREIVATRLSNELVNRLGPTFVTTIREATGALPSRIVRAFVVAGDGLGVAGFQRRIDALDGRLPGATQNALYRELALFHALVATWFVRNMADRGDLGEIVRGLSETLETLKPRLLDLASGRAREEFEARRSRWAERQVPAELAADIAMLPLLALLPDLQAVSRETGADFGRVVPAYFGVTRLFRIGRLESAILAMRPGDYYETLALERARSQISRARRRMTAAALGAFGQEADPVAAWAATGGEAFARVAEQVARLAGSGETSTSRLTLAAGLLLDLAE